MGTEATMLTAILEATRCSLVSWVRHTQPCTKSSLVPFQAQAKRQEPQVAL